MGPLKGFKLIELAGIGPTQLAGMLLAEMGADVVRVESPGSDEEGFPLPPEYNLMNRSRRSIAVDLKHPAGVEVVLRLVESADALFEGFRPGVVERLGLGPETCLERNPKLVFGRMTGWGQEGPLAQAVGHDANYIALSGVLDAIGSKDGPAIPLNLIGDFGGGSLYLVAGLLAALLEASRSGRGQVVDAAMVDGSASLMTLFHGLSAAGLWSNPRGRNLLDGGAHFYRAYETKDGKHVVVAAMEPPFHAALMEGLGLELDPDQAASWSLDPSQWPAYRERLEAVFKTRTRAEWCELLEGSNACLSPVLTLGEVSEHPHHRARESYVNLDGVLQPAPAPRFDRTPSAIRNPPPKRGQDTADVLREVGFDETEIAGLASERAIEIRSAGSPE